MKGAFSFASDLQMAPIGERPILMYHHVSVPPASTGLTYLHVSPATFARQMTGLKAMGFTTRSLGEKVPATSAREIVITFDDGLESVFQNALPVLADTGFRAIQFLVSDRLGQRNRWDENSGATHAWLMDKDQIRAWIEAGHEIGGHTRTHPRLTQLSIEEAREEIGGGKKQLEDLFGQPLQHFCYPYGDWNPTVRELVREAGYQTACTVSPGLATPTSDTLALPRLLARQRRAVKRWDRFAERLEQMRYRFTQKAFK